MRTPEEIDIFCLSKTRLAAAHITTPGRVWLGVLSCRSGNKSPSHQMLGDVMKLGTTASIHSLADVQRLHA